MNAPRDTSMNNYSKGRTFCRLVIGIFVLSTVVACASVDQQAAQPDIVDNEVMDDDLTRANLAYNNDDYEAAIKQFHSISLDSNASANDQRTAYLGQALIYLSSDKKLHSLDNAKLALRSAEQVEATENDDFSLATDLLLDAINITIGTESRYTQLKSKSGNSSSEVVRLKAERDALLADNSKLLQEQENLKDALERLKNLTLGN